MTDNRFVCLSFTCKGFITFSTIHLQLVSLYPDPQKTSYKRCSRKYTNTIYMVTEKGEKSTYKQNGCSISCFQSQSCRVFLQIMSHCCIFLSLLFVLFAGHYISLSNVERWRIAICIRCILKQHRVVILGLEKK